MSSKASLHSFGSHRTWILLVLFVLWMETGGCKKDEIEFNPVPSIEFVAISPTSVNEFTDPVIITIKYTDGDGDLGENTTGVKNCFVRDNRIGITYPFRIQQLAPDHASIQITGNLDIDIGGQGITDSTLQQTATYSVFVTDRAGHQSNTITSGSVLIRK
ncbi:MAG: hypothetical protein IT242_08310 [Bacteroidia bacterium]|nr:hypothetical protein [Bacteroidia bacterium]